MMILTGNQDFQMFSTGDDNYQIISSGNKNYTEFKYAPPDFGVGVYHDKETGIDTYYHLLELDKIVGFIKKEFEPYDRFVNPESGDYGRVNHTVIELDFKVYNKESKPWLRQELNTTKHYYINSENEPKINEIIQGLKDYGFVMSEGTVEECYYNYLGINMFGKFAWELYERK